MKGNDLKKVQMLKANECEHYDFFANCIQAITFSFAALECFSNLSIPADYVYHFKEKKPFLGLRCIKITKTRKLGGNDRRLDLNTKLGNILPEIFKVDTPKGKYVWERYVDMKRNRDTIIHFKTANEPSNEPEKFNKSLYAKFLKGDCLDAYDVAVEIIRHYYHGDEIPTWLE